jgi:hypothetical protein
MHRFCKNIELSNLMTIPQVGAELFHAERETGVTNIKSLFAILRTRLKANNL